MGYKMFNVLISHRGNIHGPRPELENKPEYIDICLSYGFMVEIDVRLINGEYYLGHDEPQYKISFDWLKERKNKLVLHCKNVESLYVLKKNFICFSHDKDDAVLVSNTNWIWTYPGKTLTNESIAVLPETIEHWDIENALGICSDNVRDYLLLKY
jgi:hypothetical protein